MWSKLNAGTYLFALFLTFLLPKQKCSVKGTGNTFGLVSNYWQVTDEEAKASSFFQLSISVLGLLGGFRTDSGQSFCKPEALTKCYVYSPYRNGFSLITFNCLGISFVLMISLL